MLFLTVSQFSFDLHYNNSFGLFVKWKIRWAVPQKILVLVVNVGLLITLRHAQAQEIIRCQIATVFRN